MVTINDRLYSTTIRVAIGNAPAVRRFISKHYGDSDELPDDAMAITMRYTPPGQADEYLIWFREIPDVEVITHECLHCALFVLHGHDVGISHKNSDPLCYYLGWLVSQVCSKIAWRAR